MYVLLANKNKNILQNVISGYTQKMLYSKPL